MLSAATNKQNKINLREDGQDYKVITEMIDVMDEFLKSKYDTSS